MIKDLAGAWYVRDLLQKPRNQISCKNLWSARIMREGGEVEVRQSISENDEISGLNEAKKRLANQQLELASDDQSDPSTQAAINKNESNMAAVSSRIKSLRNVRGQPRRGSRANENERCRPLVKKAIELAVREIRKLAPLMADHLSQSIRTGNSCIYDPSPGAVPAWEF